MSVFRRTLALSAFCEKFDISAFYDALLGLSAFCFQIYGEATLIFPLIVAETFARNAPKLNQSEPVVSSQSDNSTTCDKTAEEEATTKNEPKHNNIVK